jgi:bisphosphoglycerate-independent phosphoglycerate mutase (AlkP superfamily)
MKMNLVKMMFAAGVLTFVSFAGAANLRAQDDDMRKHDHEASQKSVASKTAKFETVAKTDALYTGAIDAHDKVAAGKMIGKDGTFKGKVAKLFSPRGGSVLILNFDSDYKTALTAVLKKADFSKFPDMSQLEGKEIVVSGKFSDYKDSPQIVLSDLKQIAVIK